MRLSIEFLSRFSPQRRCYAYAGPLATVCARDGNPRVTIPSQFPLLVIAARPLSSTVLGHFGAVVIVTAQVVCRAFLD
jgi:hypothetical protein